MNGTLAVRVLRNEMNYSAHPSIVIANRHVAAHMAGVVVLSDSDNTLCIKWTNT